MSFLPHRQSSNLLQKTSIYGDYLRDGSLSPELNVNGSVTPVVFQTQPQLVSRPLLIHHAHVSLVDEGIQWHDSFGAISVLTNGVLAEIFDRASGDTVIDLTIGVPWRRTADVLDGIGLSLLSPSQSPSPGADRLEGHMSFVEVFGGPLWLPPSQGIRIVVRDDLTGLDCFRIFVSGHHVLI